MKRNALREVAAVMAALALVNYVLRGRSSDVEPTVELARPDLNAWDLTGCYSLRVDPWEFDRLVVLGAAARDSIDTALQDDPSVVASEIELFTPPARVRLVADSTDEWGRDATTYRAFALGEDAERLEGRMRWLVRADTLWLIWSDRDARAGLALFADGDTLVGGGRAVSRSAAVTGTAQVSAWPIDCATLERERANERSRP